MGDEGSLRVALTVVANQGEAELVTRLLQAEGIDATYRVMDPTAEVGMTFGGWREILVPPGDVERARALLPAG